jgi:peptidoglycan hydrolase CwlO-like protein
MKKIIYISAVVIMLSVLGLYIPKAVKQQEINKLQKEKIKLQEQVEVLDNELQELKDTWEMYC